MRLSTLLGYFLLLLTGVNLNSQAIVTLDPPFPTGDDAVTITFDATLGNGGLENLPTTDKVYIHTGVTIAGDDWQSVVGNWGMDDGEGLMTRVGTSNIYTISIAPSIRTWYSTTSGTTIPGATLIEQLCIVFRNAAGNLTGKTSSGGDIFVDLATSSFSAAITSHSQNNLLVDAGQNVAFTGQASAAAELDFSLDGVSVASAAASNILVYNLDTDDLSAGSHTLIFSADNGTITISDTISITRHAPVNVQAIPSYGSEGISYPNGNVYLQLRAPFKDFIYVIGDFNDWNLLPEYAMNRTPDGQFYWIEISGLNPNQEYRFQYHIGWEAQRVTDPYCEKVLDPWNDQFISSATYPNLIPYPTGIAEGVVGILQINEPEYIWDNSFSYTRPAQSDIIAYELLIRDFTSTRRFTDVIEKLPYFKALGINAIELMPVAEFEGNDSWGYNPSFFMAPDKAYGPKNEFKRLVDSCHSRGIAVIVDVVFNHSFGQNPMVQMYFDPSAGEFGQPTEDSPWFNPVPRHPFNVGFDFDHESQATNYFVKKVTSHWIDEYKIDGYRFDLSKGFTQVNSGSDVGAWGQFDQSRINIILDYANSIRQTDPAAYLILEHFGGNAEELAYANNNLMVWAKGTNMYNEATMGYLSGNNQNLYLNTPGSRGWSNYAMVQYAESHDEERLMYKNLLFGNVSGSYSTKNVATALERMSLAACFLIPLPGPKMIWQFGEVGYDYSINFCANGTVSEDCRTSAKPVRWDYYNNTNRRGVFDTYRKLNYLKTNYPVFRDLNASLDLGQSLKSIKFDSNGLDAVIVGNFDVVARDFAPGFTQTGTWYDYLNGGSINVSSTGQNLSLAPGEYHVYLNQNIIPPANTYGDAPSSIASSSKNELLIYPNPFDSQITIMLPSEKQADISISDVSGRIVYVTRINGSSVISIPENLIASGLYFCTVTQDQQVYSSKIVKQ